MATAAGLIFGTARYISPEGAQGEKVGPQGDVYSIATMVYQMLAGRTPFEGDQAVALLVQQIHDAPPPLKSIARAAYVPEPIASVVMKNLSKRPEERAENARAFGRALLEAAVASGLQRAGHPGAPLASAGREGSRQRARPHRDRRPFDAGAGHGDRQVGAPGRRSYGPGDAPRAEPPRIYGRCDPDR